MKRALFTILLIGAALTLGSCFVRYHEVSVGLFASPPSPSVSVFVPAPGFPLPVYATNDMPQFPPTGTIIFWRNLALNFALSVLIAVPFWAVWRLISFAVSKVKNA